MQLKTYEILSIQTGLAQLDGHEQIVGDRPVRVPFRLSGRTALDIALNNRAAAEVSRAYVEARNDVIKTLSGGGTTLDPSDVEMIARFNEAHTGLVDEEREIAFRPIAVADLRLDENPIAPNVLAALMPILTGLD